MFGKNLWFWMQVIRLFIRALLAMKDDDPENPLNGKD